MFFDPQKCYISFWKKSCKYRFRFVFGIKSVSVADYLPGPKFWCRAHEDRGWCIYINQHDLLSKLSTCLNCQKSLKIRYGFNFRTKWTLDNTMRIADALVVPERFVTLLRVCVWQWISLIFKTFIHEYECWTKTNWKGNYAASTCRVLLCSILIVGAIVPFSFVFWWTGLTAVNLKLNNFVAVLAALHHLSF